MTLLPAFSETSTSLCLLLILLVPFAVAGLALLNTGLGRSRSAAHTMLASLLVPAVAAIVYVIFGFAWQGTPASPSHAIVMGGKSWNWIAAEHFFLRGFPFDLSAASLIVLLQLFSVGLASAIPIGTGSDRWRLGAMCASTALLAGWTYPLFGHWAWGGGWLAQLGVNSGLGRGFLDAGGSGSIQAVGGFSALSIAWIVGPRHGKYSEDDMPAAIPAHNTVFVLLGAVLATIGWIGLNAAGALLFAAAPATRAGLTVLNTVLSAGAAGLTTAIVTRVRFGRPDASLIANGWVGGLVASSAAAPFLKPAAAIIVGAVAGGVIPIVIDWLEFKFNVDDPGGAIAVHAVGGMWGLLAAGLLADVGSASGQWLAQLVGIATLVGFVLPLTYSLNWLLNRFYRQRVDEEGEWQGMDLRELGAGAYPEFAVHSDEFIPR